MFLLEPAPTQYDLHFRVLNIPVRVHPLFWLVSFILGAHGGMQSPVPVLLWVCVVFVSILVHELGHALMARTYGKSPRIVLYSFGGLATYEGGREDTRMSVLISAAGPGAGFLLAGFVLAAVHASGHPVSFERWGPIYWPVPAFAFFDSPHLNLLIFYLFYVNIWWGLVNLLPVYPLDGGQISRQLMVQGNPSDGVRQSLLLSIVTAGAMALWAVMPPTELYIAILFGLLAFSSFQMLQRTSGRGGPFGW